MANEQAFNERSPNVPTGTVTFLFTDIEGSTSMWENYPVQMEAALARHDEILHQTVEGNGGYVFKTVGDAFCAAFTTARQALETTLATQRALFSERWHEHAKVRVRMALHTGVAEERGGDYFGPPVNRVARLLSAGHGGQTLLSAVTYGLVRDALSHVEPEADLKDLGEHRLKDLKHAERIFQLTVPDLPEEFPNLKTLDTRSDERYGLMELVGSGGMSEVYLAHDQELGRNVAFKTLKNQYAEDEQFVERFRREAENAASLSHPNIVAVYDRGQTQDGAYYIVMEYVPGDTLKERIERDGPLPPEEAAGVALQVAKALRVAHEKGVIHRDIKPQNVLLAESGEAKVADFGIARAAASSTVTKTGFVMGTAHYLSPEQALGGPASPRSDLYSLGVVLYEMLTGKLPHDAETPVEIAMQHISGQVRPPREIDPEVPDEVNAVAMRLLARDPEERYQDATEVIADLEQVSRDGSPASSPRRQDPGGATAAPDPATASSETPTAPSPLETGDAVGPGEDRYNLERLLGSGGMAEVYLAHDQELGRDVAFKKLRQLYAEDEEVIERFRREAKNAASLSHSNIVSIHDRGRTRDGAYYIVMEYAPGGTLKERIQRGGPLPPGETLSLTLQVAKALRAAHERGMIHRDIKPQNVLLTESGEAKVADFGIARAASSATMTKTGSVMGTAHYLSPEQALGNPASPKSDLYSLGVVLYEILTGEVPHDAETPVGIAMKHVNGQLRPPKEIDPEVPEEMNAVTVRLLARDPEDRYENAAELVEDLERIQRGVVSPAFSGARQQQDASLAATPTGAPPEGSRPSEEPDDVPPPPPARRPRGEGSGGDRRGRALPWVVGAAGLLVVLALAGGVAYLQSGPALAALPNVVGESQTEAEAALVSEGFQVETQTRESSEADNGTVLEQSPPSGEEAEENSTVEITVGEWIPPPEPPAPEENPSYQKGYPYGKYSKAGAGY